MFQVLQKVSLWGCHRSQSKAAADWGAGWQARQANREDGIITQPGRAASNSAWTGAAPSRSAHQEWRPTLQVSSPELGLGRSPLPVPGQGGMGHRATGSQLQDGKFSVEEESWQLPQVVLQSHSVLSRSCSLALIHISRTKIFLLPVILTLFN